MIKKPNWLFAPAPLGTPPERCLRLVLVCPALHICGNPDPPVIVDGTVITGATSGAVGVVLGDQSFVPPNPTFIVHQDVPVDYIVGETIGLTGWTILSQTVVRCSTNINHRFNPTRDTYLDEGSPTTNRDTANLRFGRESNFANRTIMNFDVSSLIGATVLDATITLEITTAASPTGGGGRESWTYTITEPEPPLLIDSTIVLNNPTLAAIQASINSNGGLREYQITGTVTGITSQLSTGEDHIYLNFTGAAAMTWAGSGNSGRFINLTGDHVKLEGLQFNGNSHAIGGISVGDGGTDCHIKNCVFDHCHDTFFSGFRTRLKLEGCDFINASTGSSSNRGYAAYLGSGTGKINNVLITDCLFSTLVTSEQYPLRVQEASYFRLIDSECYQRGAKKSFWIYGCDHAQLTRVTFRRKRMNIGCSVADTVTGMAVASVRVDDCLFLDHVLDVGETYSPIIIECGKGLTDLKMQNCTWTNCDGTYSLAVGDRDVGDSSRDINWYPATMLVDGVGFASSDVYIANDWTPAELTARNIMAVSTGGSGASVGKVRRVTRVWIENQATWNVYSTGNAWTAPGGDTATPEVDIALPPLSQSTDFPGFAAMVIDAIDNHAGVLELEWMLTGDTDNGVNDYCVFRDSEYATLTMRPLLTVNVSA